MSQRSVSNLGLVVAELIRRMTPQEKTDLLSYLPLEELEEFSSPLASKKSERRFGDPELYVATRDDGLSLEVPPEKALEFVSRLPYLLGSKKINIRYYQNGSSKEITCLPEEIPGVLNKIEAIFADDAIIIELNEYTLFSNGGGCMLLEADLSGKMKRDIAEYLLEICGIPQKLTKDRFSITVWPDKTEVKER